MIGLEVFVGIVVLGFCWTEGDEFMVTAIND
jgi:hypothetical protein